MTRCEVWGSPIAHSLSPLLHRAAYDALGLDWTYAAREVDEDAFPAALGSLGDDVAGLSLTMPLKERAHAAAASLDAPARETGAVNTLVRTNGGWDGFNTDVLGIRAALAEGAVGGGMTGSASDVGGASSGRHTGVGARGLVVGSGATARSAVAALGQLGVRDVTFMVRSGVRPRTREQAEAAGMTVATTPLGRWVPADLVVSTVPPAALDVSGIGALGEGRRPVVLDAVYGTGDTPLLAATRAAQWGAVDGTRMLLHQAVAQVSLMTGRADAATALSTMTEALTTRSV